MKTDKYDIIGDIHGCDRTLCALLEKLGYVKNDGVYSHTERKAIFLGDFVDRGPGQRAVIDIVRPMVEKGNALSVMGNHEFNAIAYATYDQGRQDYLRSHSAKNQGQHKAFLDAYEQDEQGYRDTIAWFKTLPLWLDLGGIRVIHACWDRQYIDRLDSPYLNEELIYKSAGERQWQYEAIETLLKGKELPLSNGLSFKDKDGNIRHDIRVRWWDKGATTYQSAYLGPEEARTYIPDDETGGDHLVDYGHSEPPVFLGHYWFHGDPAPLAPNIACVDYSVGKPGGKLVAYRWDGEQVLSKDKFVWVERVE